MLMSSVIQRRTGEARFQFQEAQRRVDCRILTAEGHRGALVVNPGDQVKPCVLHIVLAKGG